MIIPPALKKGDSIALISTARKIDHNDLKLAIETIESKGYLVQLGENLLASDNQFCGTDEQRASDLQLAINDTQIKAILCFRGGYGTVRILDKVDLSPLINSPKWIGGYSDVSALHNALDKIGVASLHSTMPVNFKNNTTESIDSLFDALKSKQLNYQFDGHSMNIQGECKGKLVGGNLSMLYSLSGTKYDINTDECILFIEDLDEYLYHVDRMMQNLKLGGKLDNLKGMIVGGMTDMNDNDTPFGKQAKEIILEAVQTYDFPICFDFPAGHIDDNRTIVLGKEASLMISTSEVTFNQ